MAKHKNGVNKSEEVRQLLKANPAITAKEVADKLAEKGIKVAPNLFYFVKGQMKGRKSRKHRAQKVVTSVVASTHGSRIDAVATILKVKALANEVGGMKTLKALVEALSE
jgi:hypothetical protein